MIRGMANHPLIISEPVAKTEPYAPGEHSVEAEAREIPERYYGTHRSGRADFVDWEFGLVTKELRMEAFISRILSLIEGLRNRSKVGS
jgi:hypothetical protein